MTVAIKKGLGFEMFDMQKQVDRKKTTRGKLTIELDQDHCLFQDLIGDEFSDLVVHGFEHMMESQDKFDFEMQRQTDTKKSSITTEQDERMSVYIPPNFRENNDDYDSGSDIEAQSQFTMFHT